MWFRVQDSPCGIQASRIRDKRPRFKAQAQTLGLRYRCASLHVLHVLCFLVCDTSEWTRISCHCHFLCITSLALFTPLSMSHTSSKLDQPNLPTSSFSRKVFATRYSTFNARPCPNKASDLSIRGIARMVHVLDCPIVWIVGRLSPLFDSRCGGGSVGGGGGSGNISAK